MAKAFLHGVETIEIQDGPTTITEVKTAVIGLIGIAPAGPKQACVLVRSDVDAAQFGKKVPGFNIPQSLSHIFSQGAGTVVVVNVFDETKHTTQVTDEEKTIADGALKLSAAPIGTVTVKKQDGTASGYVIGTDYIIDSYGNFQVIPGRIPNGTVLKLSFKKFNASAVTNSDIIGEVDEQGNRTGIKALDNAFSQFGFKPKILITPGYSSIASVVQELLTSASKLRAIAYIDAPVGLTVNEVIESRGEASNFFTSDSRAVPVFPYLKAYDEASDSDQLFPYSAFLAGVTAFTDNQFGYWYSPSNKEIRGITGIERPISAGLSDENSDANFLNANGIVTVFNSFGTGFRSWGNRNASFPTNKHPDSFIANRRIADVVMESMELAMIEFMDRPLNMALVDDIRESGNNFIKVLIGRGALLEGSKVIFDKADNPNDQLAAGKVVFQVKFMGPTPAEDIVFKYYTDISLFSVLK